MANLDDGTPRGSKSGNGLTRVLISTAVAGAAGFVIQIGVGILMGPGEQYLSFSVFWSALYLVIGALSGIQQEVARASAQGIGSERGTGTSLWRFIAFSGTIVVSAIGISSLLWGEVVFEVDVGQSVVFLALGALGYVVLASQSGVLYGTGRWNILALSIVADPVLRCAFLAVAVGAMLGVYATQLAVVIPLFVTTGLVGLIWWKSKMAVELDVGIRRLLWNVSRAVVGSAATAILVSGFPLFLKVSLQGTDPELVATIIFVINFTRAPIVIPLLALQSYMIVSFAKNSTHIWNRLLKICGTAFGAAIFIAVVGFFLSPWVFGVVLGGAYLPNPAFVGSVVAASGLTAALCATGSAALSKSLHGVFSAGWLAAAVTSVLLLFVPFSPEGRVILALSVGPIVGLMIHGLGLARAVLPGRRI